MEPTETLGPFEKWAASVPLTITCTSVPPLSGIPTPVSIWTDKKMDHWAVECSVGKRSFFSRFAVGRGFRDAYLSQYFRGEKKWPSGSGLPPSKVNPPVPKTLAWVELVERMGPPPPSIESIVRCWHSEFTGARTCVGFEEWAEYTGCDSDSISDKACYETVLSQYAEFRRLLTHDQLTAFFELKGE